MSYQIRQPITSLRPYIHHLAISRAETAQNYNVLPDTGLVVGFQFSGRLSHIVENLEQPLHTSGITGLLDTYRVFKNNPETGSVLIVFTETGATNFLNIPIVPNKFSIIRCLSEGNGLAILPDFLCREAMDDHKILKIWEGYKPIENTLYFCKRKQSLFMNEIDLIEKMLVDELR